MGAKKVYLDFQIFDSCAKQASVLNWIKYKTGYTYYCSTAHFEELHRALMNAKTELAKSQAQAIKSAISSLCVAGVLNPGAYGIFLKKEHMDSCLERIEKYDTTETIQQTAKRLKNNHTQPPAFSHNYHESDEQWKAVWEEAQIRNAICELNRKHLTPEQLILLHYKLMQTYGQKVADGLLKQLKEDMCEVSFGCYQEIKNSYGKMEYVIEQLARILSRFGYYRDSNVRTFNSGEYDITHLIYGTFCDYFITEDAKLRSRALAIYYYLQAPVQVMSLADYKNIS